MTVAVGKVMALADKLCAAVTLHLRQARRVAAHLGTVAAWKWLVATGGLTALGIVLAIAFFVVNRVDPPSASRSAFDESTLAPKTLVVHQPRELIIIKQLDVGYRSETLPPLAWGPARPSFTMDRPAPLVVFNSIVDNPVAGDERPFLTVAKGDGTPAVNQIVIRDGQELILRIFYGNDAAPNVDAVSENTRVSVLLPLRPARRTWATAFITSDNANPRTTADTVVFEGPRPFALHYVLGSARIYNNTVASKFRTSGS